MATRRQRAPEEESVPQIPQSTPTTTGYPARDHDYLLQYVVHKQRTLGAMDAKLDATKASNESLKSIVDDLVG